MASGSFSLFLLVVAIFKHSTPVLSQGCVLPDASTIRDALQTLLRGTAGEGTEVTVTLFGYNYTCLAVASRDRYRYLSVSVHYNKTTEAGDFVSQISLECSGNVFTVPSTPSASFNQFPPPNVTNIETRRDCRVCTAQTDIPNTDTIADCVGE